MGVSVNIGKPDYYGHIDIGGAPALVYSQPVVVMQAPQSFEAVYRRVPLGHMKDWEHYYGACDRPVYFIQSSWYQDVHVAHYRKQRGHGGGSDKGQGKGNDKGHSN